MSVDGQQPTDDIVVDEGADEGGDWDATADDDPAGDEMDDGVFDWFIPSGAPYAFPGSSNDAGAAAGASGTAAAWAPEAAAAGAQGAASGTPGAAAGTAAAGSPGTAAAAGTPGTAPAGGADGPPGGAIPAGDNIDLTSLIAHLTNESDESAMIDEVRMLLDEVKASQQMAMQKIETVTRIAAQSILESRQVQAMVRDLQTLLIRVIQDRPVAGAGHPPPGQPSAPSVHDISEL